jgi:hypothetical protein
VRFSHVRLWSTSISPSTSRMAPCHDCRRRGGGLNSNGFTSETRQFAMPDIIKTPNCRARREIAVCHWSRTGVRGGSDNRPSHPASGHRVKPTASNVVGRHHLRIANRSAPNMHSFTIGEGIAPLSSGVFGAIDKRAMLDRSVRQPHISRPSCRSILSLLLPWARPYVAASMRLA